MKTFAEIHERTMQVVDLLNAGADYQTLPDYDAETTALYEGGGETVIALTSGHVLRKGAKWYFPNETV